jgi:hypothetical protein
MPRRRAPAALTHPTLHTFVGSTLLHRLDDPARAPLRVGSQVWSTYRLARDLGVTNTHAARLLSIAAASIGAKNVRDLYDKATPYVFAGLPGCGETTMYVLWRLFEACGLDPDAWAHGDRGDALVSFRSLKKREAQGEQRTAAAAQRRHPSATKAAIAAEMKKTR